MKEYWIVDPVKERVNVYHFPESDQTQEYTFSATVRVGIYKDLALDLGELKHYLER